MLHGHRTVAAVLAVLVTIFILFKPPRLNDLPPLPYLKVSVKASPDILNGTIGFQQVFVINLPSRTDRRDAMTLAAALSKIDVTWADGVTGEAVVDKAMPGDSWDKSISKGNRGSWRGHMNVLQRVVRENMTSALILEDDADWDIRLKMQMQVFAQGARAFTQPVTGKPRTTVADSYLDDTKLPLDLPVETLPSNLRPALTPYGDSWDVLWLGHCGTQFPTRPSTAAEDPTSADTSTKAESSSYRPPLLRVVVSNDGTVPAPEHLKAHPFALQDPLAELYPPYTRIVHASSATTCTQAYAVSQQGARKLLWQFGLQSLTTGWDLMLRDWCDGLYHSAGVQGDGSTPPVCVTIQPPLFSHHFGKGAASDITAPGGGFVNKDKEMTPYVRLSVRLNMGRLVGGDGYDSLVDQWPDEKRDA